MAYIDLCNYSHYYHSLQAEMYNYEQAGVSHY